MKNKRRIKNKELEAYAALVLVKTAQICEPFSTDWLKDRPDLQIRNFGIEVTRAVDQEDAKGDHYDSEFLKCESFENVMEEINNLEDPEKYRSVPNQIPGSDRFSLMSGGGYDDKKPLNLIVKAIKVKSEKFLKYPNHDIFTQRGLYIFDDELRPCLERLDIKSIAKATNDSVFDIVFVQQLKRLIVVTKGDIHEISFDQNSQNDAKCEAKRVCGSSDYEICCKRAKEYRESITC